MVGRRRGVKSVRLKPAELEKRSTGRGTRPIRPVFGPFRGPTGLLSSAADGAPLFTFVNCQRGPAIVSFFPASFLIGRLLGAPTLFCPPPDGRPERNALPPAGPVAPAS